MKKWLMTAAALALSATAAAQEKLELEDVFTLEYASAPTIHPSGDWTVFVRQSMDIQNDRKVGRLWASLPDGDLRPLTGEQGDESQPVWSPSGDRLAYVSTKTGSPQIHIYWADSGETAAITQLTQAPAGLSWSPDGTQIAFSMFAPKPTPAPVSLPGKPEGADWTAPPQYIDKGNYRYDGGGYAKDGHQQIYVIPATGGSPRQLTEDAYHHTGQLAWSPNGEQLFFSANRRENSFLQPVNSEIYRLDLKTQQITAITERNGPDNAPKVSPNGKKIAFTGYTDEKMSYQISKLYVMDLDGSNVEVLTPDLDRSVSGFQWDPDSDGLYFTYDNEGIGQLARTDLEGDHTQLVQRVGGLSYSRPYGGGDFSVANNDNIAFTLSNPQRPAELALFKAQSENNAKVVQLTHLNEDALAHKQLAKIEEIRYQSSVDGKQLQGWIAYPPGFDKNKDYPLMLEIHGGPHTNYGPRFAAEIQLFAAAGYVVLYTNPRGSTSYGADFANEIHHNYPGNDYDDLMDGVDAVIDKGFIKEDELFVTGGSGGGVLTAWIVGHTDRFKAAVVAKPVINWYSFVLTADMYNFFYQYWFPGLPWNHTEHYMERSPISYVGNVTTPTMLLTGENDYRTPISETEQYYQALKLKGVETAMVRIQDSGHGIYARPSNLMNKVAYILHWFEKYRGDK
ncbi:S9 family peptidase [Idiomarina sp. HP20-50]|uniref:S9 family peptidase n=1 Tax=Idiomarina sp. HP20-50 TaxID=3070813 RepID=UPI00294B024B|nr:S9 family peptidase [Idiomarina sp. HP20-50]MDV6316089.1 S9 family peptidase [Idiomarina sp. HP20-50]